ncbi:MAG: DUF2924 domain-containing protein [Magnetococcales bacterium]|nr:DUF2924 domain-containing protein [Magnetococcales bacterium]
MDDKVKVVLDSLLKGDDRLIRLIITQDVSLSKDDVRAALPRVVAGWSLSSIQTIPSLVVHVPDVKNELQGNDRSKRNNRKNVSIKDLMDAGLLSSGSVLELKYKNNNYNAKIDHNGDIVYEGVSRKSLSAAAKLITKSENNGWDSWKIRENGRLISLSDLRNRLDGDNCYDMIDLE